MLLTLFSDSVLNSDLVESKINARRKMLLFFLLFQIKKKRPSKEIFTYLLQHQLEQKHYLQIIYV